MSTTEDPFERAAKRERQAKAQEAYAKLLQEKGSAPGFGKTPGAGVALRVFLLPYVVLMAIRALRFPWGEPTIGDSVFQFFFGSLLVASATIGILVLLWIWVIARDRVMRDWMG
ncbi:MAG: hypothetical protein KY429_00910 [Actinobacteria bacterium]|nr:hypothetical protein [Actinomycetota bacterium]